MGKKLHVTYGQQSSDFIVTGVSTDPPTNSSIQFNLLIHIANLPTAYGSPNLLHTYATWWGTPIFVHLKENASIAGMEQRFHQFTSQHFASHIGGYRANGWWSRQGNPFSFYLQPIEDVHLDIGAYQGRGMTAIYILSSLAIMVLLIASINFTNLTMGIFSVRSNEIWIRKVIGAEKKQLILQFWGESLIMTIMALAGGILLTLLFLPAFNILSGKMLNAGGLLNMKSLVSVLILMVLTAFIAGAYPAFVMADLRPVDIMKKKLTIKGGIGITRVLVVFQFILSTGLILSTLILSDQLYFLTHKDLGYEKEGLIVVRTQEGDYENSHRIINAFRNRLAGFADVKAVTACHAAFGLARWPRSGDPGKGVYCHFNMVDSLFVKTLGLRIVEGRDFMRDLGNPAGEALVNQSFINALGLDHSSGIVIDPASIDKMNIPAYLNQTRIVGVIEDFHFSVLSHEIFPAIFHLRPVYAFTRIIVRIDTRNIQSALRHLEEAWKEVQPEKPFIHYFQDDVLENLYQSQKQWSAIIRYVSILTIIIACLGMLGLTANMISRRFKEIGIRRVLGAGTGNVMGLIMKGYMILVVLANMIAWPVVVVIMKKVLQDFTYRISIGIQHFLFAGLISLALAMGTILFLVLKAARANPVESLRYE